METGHWSVQMTSKEGIWGTRVGETGELSERIGHLTYKILTYDNFFQVQFMINSYYTLVLAQTETQDRE